MPHLVPPLRAGQFMQNIRNFVHNSWPWQKLPEAFSAQNWQINICTENSYSLASILMYNVCVFTALPKKLRAKSMVDLRSIRPHLRKINSSTN
jgi:hypothetical protein